jgi:ABC-2 type transport system ATP-binding protein
MSLQLISVSRRFGDQLALDSVSLHVRAGDCYGFIGHNGAGKTTAMRVALGLALPDAGRVLVDGFDAREHPREARARMGGLIEAPGFHPSLDATANLVLLARLQGMSSADARAEARKALERVGLEGVGRKHVHAFSQGMRQRLGIAQALLGDPAYVLLDEPTNGLDPQGMAEMRELLRRLVRESKLSVLISSHQLHELADLCNRVGVLHRGKMLVEAETRELLAAAPGRFELSTSDDARAARLLAELGIRSESLATGGLALDLGARPAGDLARQVVGAGLELQRFGARPPSLEEIYLQFARGEAAAARPASPSPEVEASAPRERRAPPSPVWRTLRYECSRTFSKWSTAALMALPALVAAGSVAMEKSRALAEEARVASGELATATAVTGFGSTASALGAGLPLLAMAVAGIASQMIAGEQARGTLRNVLLRPQTRVQVVVGKAIAGLLLTLGAYALLVATALAASAVCFGFESLVEILPNGEEFPLVSAEELRPELVRALLAPVAALVGFFTIGFLAGTFLRGAAGALGLAIGALLGLDLARGVARGFGAEGYLLSAYVPTPLGDTSYVHYFADRAQGISNSTFEWSGSFAGVPQDVACPLVWIVACVGLSAILLARRSIP